MKSPLARLLSTLPVVAVFAYVIVEMVALVNGLGL